MQLDVSTPAKEGVLQISKSRKIPLLIDENEMRELFKILSPFWIFDVSRPVSLTSAEISQKAFLAAYAKYIQGIKTGCLIDERSLGPLFSSAFTLDPKAFYAMGLKDGRYLIKARSPVIQLQRHHFVYSDGFYSGVMGKESITWGIQFSYPQLFLDPKTQIIGKVTKDERFTSSELFYRFTKWVRDHTSATPFSINGKRLNHSMRLGKKCFSWIQNHPDLRAKGLNIYA